GLRDRQHLEPAVARLLRRLRALAEAYDDARARVLEVQGVGVALGTEADDRDGLAVEEGEVCVVVVVHGARDPIFLAPPGVLSRAPGHGGAGKEGHAGQIRRLPARRDAAERVWWRQGLR